MRVSRTRAALVVSAVSLAVAAVPFITSAGASDQSSSPDANKFPNVLVKITLGKIEGGQRKPLRSYSLLASGSGRPARMSTANRIPLPAVMLPHDDKTPVTSFSYQNIGFQADVRASIVGDDAVRINADIEDTALYNPEAVHTLDSGDHKVAPVVSSFTQSIEAMVRGGTPALSTLVDDPKGQSMYIQVGAEIQR